MIPARFDPVAGRRFRIFRKRREARFHGWVPQLGIARHHDIFLRVFFIGPRRGLLPLAGLHDALGMGHPGTHLQEGGGIEPLGKLVGQLSECERLRAVRRLQHGELGRLRVMAGILLVLGAVHARVVRHADDHPGVHAGVGDGKQRVCRHVEPHVLHAAEAPLARERGAESRLHGHLFVRGPFGIDLRILCGGFADLRAGRARIAGEHGTARLIQAPGNRFIAKHECFHDHPPYTFKAKAGKAPAFLRVHPAPRGTRAGFLAFK